MAVKGNKTKAPKVNAAGRVNLGMSNVTWPYPDFLYAQRESYAQFLEQGFTTLFEEISPVKDAMEKMWTIYFKDLRFGDLEKDVMSCTDKGLTYDRPLYVTAQLQNTKTGEIKQQEVFVADVPVMTKQGFFIINGVRRVVTHQIVRAEGVLYDVHDRLPTKVLYSARIIPYRGQWFEIEVNRYGVLSMRLAYKRPKVLITELLRVFGYETDDEIRALFKDVDTDENTKYIEATLARDLSRNKVEAIVNIYNKIRPDENVSIESAEKFIKSVFFSESRFLLGRIGRYQINRKLGLNTPLDGEQSKFSVEDFVQIIKRLIQVNNGVVPPDDVDSLSNRRIRSVGEVLVEAVRAGTKRMEKSIKDKMGMYGEDAKLTPSMLISPKPIQNALYTFFGSNQLSQFMDQLNIFSEMANKRKVSAGGPGGLSKETATFSVREVHQTHYSRLDPVTSPEGASIGIVNEMAMYARVNEFGFLEAPYRKIGHTVSNTIKALEGRILKKAVKSGNKIIAKPDVVLTKEDAQKIAKLKDIKELEVYPYVTDDIEYMDSLMERGKSFTTLAVDMDENLNITEQLVPVRKDSDFLLIDADDVDYIDVVPAQQAGIGMSLVPFIAHNESRRALTGSNQQRQAVPLLRNESPVIGTGLEEEVARQSGWGRYAKEDGVVMYVDGKRMKVKYNNGEEEEYKIIKFFRSNQDSSFTQKPLLQEGDAFKKGDVLIDGPTMDHGELALGVNIRVALMSFAGYNYEDAVIISERILRDDVLTSVHIKEYVYDLRETDLGPELLTADIPHVNEAILQKLDDRGVVRIGARVSAGDILAGVVAPRGEVELTAEERLLRAIFGEASSDMRDNSLRVPHGSKGIVIRTQHLSAAEGDKLPSGVREQVKVWVAQTKKMDYGDKIAGRHGDKNTVAAIRPVEDMPFTEDGRPVDMVLTPLFIKRMNMGQGLEVHYGYIADLLGIKLAVPLFEKINEEWLNEQLEKEGFERKEKVDLYDGRTGLKFPRPVSVGMKYTLKLKHIAGEKVHARSTGSYTMVTQQPLGGKAQFGGQKFGEMEVWALESHGVPYALQEMLTIKSDDIQGRAQAYKAIIHGEKILGASVPESFKVLVRELNALNLNINLIEPKVEETEEEETPDTEGEEL